MKLMKVRWLKCSQYMIHKEFFKSLEILVEFLESQFFHRGPSMERDPAIPTCASSTVFGLPLPDGLWLVVRCAPATSLAFVESSSGLGY